MRIPNAHELSADQIASLAEAVETAHAGLSALHPELEAQRLEQLDLVLDAVRAALVPSHPTNKDLDSMVREILGFVQKARDSGFSPTVLSADTPETLCVGYAAFYVADGKETHILRNVKITAMKEAGIKYPHLMALELFNSGKGRKKCAALLTAGVDILDPAAVAAAPQFLVEAIL